ncbi:MAG: DNA-3-methyladenine glycosylase 2 family protein [Chloroflexi bacterium]|nr:DNA-3-methyladenine glycosylase 2 family protein [Chloroflexota bacterium]
MPPVRRKFSIRKANAHLRDADPVLALLIDEHGTYEPRPSPDPWSALVRAILFQQLAGAAASSIQRKWYGFYGDEESTPTPEQVLATTDEDFRACGISRQKMSYFRDLALRTSDGRLKLSRLNRMSDEDVIKALTAVKGVGEWTAHMHLMFHLGRPDILPIGDLGVRKGMQLAYRLDEMPTLI